MHFILLGLSTFTLPSAASIIASIQGIEASMQCIFCTLACFMTVQASQCIDITHDCAICSCLVPCCTCLIRLIVAWQEEGLALFGLSASPDSALYQDSIIRFWGPRPHGLPYHTLSQGDIVLISKTAPGTCLQDAICPFMPFVVTT